MADQDFMMNVPGQRPAKGHKKPPSSDAGPYCAQCETTGKRLPAHGYCQTCSHYLCKDCFLMHTQPLPLKHHVLMDSARMPKVSQSPPGKTAAACTITCKDHNNEVIKFYCTAHKSVDCSVCAIIRHKPCDVHYIPDIAVDCKDGQEYSDFKDTLDNLDDNADAYQKTASDEIQQAIEAADKALEGVRTFRTEIVDDLDAKEKNIVKLVKELRSIEQNRTATVDSNFQLMKAEVQKMKSQLKSFEKNDSDLFVVMKQCTSTLAKLRDQIEQAFASMTSVRFHFEREHAYQSTLSASIPLGKINKQVNKSQLTHTMRPSSTPRALIDFATVKVSKVSEIGVKSSTDTGTFFITGLILLPPSTLLAADYNSDNKSIKAIDTVTGTVSSQLKMASDPWDIAILPQDEAAVTLPGEQQIQVISTSGALSPVRKIKVNGECYGIDTSEDKFVVSYINPSKVEVLDHHGGLLHTISTDLRDQTMFTWPDYVTISREEDKDVIHVSDWNTNAVIKMSVDGQILYTYKDGDLSCPLGLVTTGDGHLLVCNRNNYNIHVVSKDGKKVRTLLGKDDLSAYPYSVCFSPVDKKLYVGLRDCDKMKVVQFT